VLEIQIEKRNAPAGAECNRAHSCLSGDQDCLCEVEQLLDDTILSVTPPPGMKCTHKMRYRHTFLCTCPVRKEIYRRYKV
jgi:hypothetical protein